MSRYKISKTTYDPKLREVIDVLLSKPKSANRDDILNWLQYTELVDNYIKKLEYADIPDETVQDEIQEIWLEICEIPQSKWDRLYYQGTTAIKAYISGLIYREIHSNTSKIYNKYKKPYLMFKRISDESWEVFDETGEMLPTNEDYSIRENDLDILKRLIETDKIEEIFADGEKTRKTKNH